ncbi:hypothetical protein B0H10DRAFT_1971726 [Mycena sp. CBHHK59/15]|nr:hypothetical protein B0H10DRAFT_1971726 [Mycena sp. CBHHK59/15]
MRRLANSVQFLRPQRSALSEARKTGELGRRVGGPMKVGRQPRHSRFGGCLGVVEAIHDLSDPEIIKKAFEMCRTGDYNFSQASLTSPEALERLRRLPDVNSVLHTELTQETAAVPASDVEEEPFLNLDVYDDCDIPLDVVSGLLLSGGSSIAANFAVNQDGGLARAGDAEKSDAETDEAAPVVLGRGQRKKIVNTRYEASLWEGH